MSTKSSLVSGPSFHLYEECFDPAKNVWLDLDGCEFEATPRGLRIEIPLAVWEVIRQHTPARFDLTALTDAQLQAEAEKRVDSQRAGLQATLDAPPGSAPNPEVERRPSAASAFFYRHARLPREEHLGHVLADLRDEHEAQCALLQRIAQLKAARHSAPPEIADSPPGPQAPYS
jgi:hypothetical protein